MTRPNPFVRLMRASLLAIAASSCASAAVPYCDAKNTVTAEVVALEQVYYYNRFGSFNPAGMMFALKIDVEPIRIDQPLDAGNVRLKSYKRPRPLVLRVNEGDCLEVAFWNMLSPVPPPATFVTAHEHALDPPNRSTKPIEIQNEGSEFPATRAASMHVNGLNYVKVTKADTDKHGCDAPGNFPSDGANVGDNDSSLVKPGKCTVYKWYGKKEGGFFLFSAAANAGGEGDGGQIGLGLFGAVNVEPRGSKWYRSQVTHEQLQQAATLTSGKVDYSKIDYDRIAMLDRNGQIRHSDLNAIVYVAPNTENCTESPLSSKCGEPFREFTTIFHDELTAVQSFAELADEHNPANAIKDGMGINYGSAGMGSPVLANLKKIGPAANCAECKFEEFFLSSWANGDPAMVVEPDPVTGKAMRALYPDDPSNVHHSYMGDPVRFRNMHAGPKETHVFHLHAHQWSAEQRDDRSTYLDSQTISPGSSYTYDIQYGGSGNRNGTVGDSIFHCHLYPHFAQGMWELWRSHDVFEDGSHGMFDAKANPRGRNLPDAEIAGGTPNPAVVPIPGRVLALEPKENFRGYPFYIGAMPGHRPPQPPLDMDTDENGVELNGGLSRHIVVSGTAVTGVGLSKDELFKKGGDMPEFIARRVDSRNASPNLTLFAKQLTGATIRVLPRDGTPEEKMAMKFHAGEMTLDEYGKPGQSGVDLKTPKDEHPTDARKWWDGKGYPSVRSALPGGAALPPKPLNFFVNGMPGQPGAPFADPCPRNTPTRNYRAAYVQFDMTVNKYGWHDPQARIALLEEDIKDTILLRKRAPEPLFIRANSGECIVFKATNLVPSALNLDDFQIYSPTDIIGQHIHLVKFDVTSSDGSGNGWNYEDGTFSPDEVRERIKAHNTVNPLTPIKLRTNPLFGPSGALKHEKRGRCADDLRGGGSDTNVWCGAQTTVQRWYADPLMSTARPGLPSKDRTLRTIFTHDHFGPSSHQHHGLYSALVVEPAGSRWETLKGDVFGGTGTDGKQPMVMPNRKDGGPTTYAANIQAKDKKDTRREFNLAFADFSLLYTADLRPVNPPSRDEEAIMPGGLQNDLVPQPEGISAQDPGTQLINYRNEPLPLRIGTKEEGGETYRQKRQGEAPAPTPPACNPYALDMEVLPKIPQGQVSLEGNLAFAFSSKAHCPAGFALQKKQPIDAEVKDPKKKELLTRLEDQRVNFVNSLLTEPWRTPGDPSTPLLAAYEGDPVSIRLIQGAQEEQHVFTMHGMRWLAQVSSPNSGYMNGQQIGISEHMEFDSPVSVDGVDRTDLLYLSSATDNLWDGMWGLMRVIGFNESKPIQQLGLKRLQGTTMPKPGVRGNTSNVCDDKSFEKMRTGLETVFAVGAFQVAEIYGGRVDKALAYNKRFGIKDPNAIVFVKYPFDAAETRTGIVSKLQIKYKSQDLEPLILRAPAGSCIQVTLRNFLPSVIDDSWRASRHWTENLRLASFNMVPPIVEGLGFNQLETSTFVGLHPQLVSVNVRNKDGANIGLNDESAVQPPSTPDKDTNQVYIWYAGDRKLQADGSIKHIPIEFGAVNLFDRADSIKHTSHGAVGGLIIEPEGSTVEYPFKNSMATADIRKDGKLLFRDFMLIYQDDLSVQYRNQPLQNLRGGDDSEDSGHKAFNYRSEPFWARLGLGDPSVSPEESQNADFSNVLSSKDRNNGCQGPCGQPETPFFTAEAGTPVRFRILHPGGHPRQHSFSLFGHDWDYFPWTKDSTVIGDNWRSAKVGTVGGIGPARHLNLPTCAGGEFGIAGDYLYRTQESFQFQGGLWGIFRVTDKTTKELKNVYPGCTQK